MFFRHPQDSEVVQKVRNRSNRQERAMRTVLAVIEHGRRVVGGEQAAGQRSERHFAYGMICPLGVFSGTRKPFLGYWARGGSATR